MASFQFNLNTLKKQRRVLSLFLMGLIFISIIATFLLSDGKSHRAKKEQAPVDLTGIVDASFSESNAQSALTAQQSELESLKKQMKVLKASVRTLNESQLEAKNKAESPDVSALLAEKLAPLSSNKAPTPTALAQNTYTEPTVMSDASPVWSRGGNGPSPRHAFQSTPKIHSVSFHYRRAHHKRQISYLNPEHYVPSGTFVRAVILGGADADASVNGQSKNNGVMLFKLVQPGTLPNGARSHLQGCFVTGSSYGDISSERAYVILDKLSCVLPGQPIIDKSVTGWAFFGGKVGIKGQPLMRDNKVMQWAGISGALSGIATAAQYAQSVQSISTLGATSVVPSSSIGPYAAYGGASKAADVLSTYYVKRAEQYHPVIQVGSGNVVTIVFKDGFYLEPDEDKHQRTSNPQHAMRAKEIPETPSELDDNADFTVPPEVLSRIDRVRTEEGA